jgi:hypothetical protein
MIGSKGFRGERQRDDFSVTIAVGLLGDRLYDVKHRPLAADPRHRARSSTDSEG